MNDPFDVPLVEVTMLLADAAQVADNKLFILGGGITQVGPKPQPISIAMVLSVPWDRANISHAWKLELLDEDGMPVIVNENPLLLAGNFEAGRPIGSQPGTPLTVPLSINFNGLPLHPGKSYVWRLSINDHSESSWSVRFSVRPEK